MDPPRRGCNRPDLGLVTSEPVIVRAGDKVDRWGNVYPDGRLHLDFLVYGKTSGVLLGAFITEADAVFFAGHHVDAGQVIDLTLERDMPESKKDPYEAYGESVTEAEDQPKGEHDATVDSTSDGRVINNTMRHKYRVLDEEEKDQMEAVKDHGLGFVEVLDEIGGSRELSLAKTRIEEAVMWAVKHITR